MTGQVHESYCLKKLFSESLYGGHILVFWKHLNPVPLVGLWHD